MIRVHSLINMSQKQIASTAAQMLPMQAAAVVINHSQNHPVDQINFLNRGSKQLHVSYFRDFISTTVGIRFQRYIYCFKIKFQ